MSDLTVTIGGEAIALPPALNFATLKRAWPAIQALGEADDTITRVDAAIRIIAAVLYRLRPELTSAEIEERLMPNEMEGLALALPVLFESSGVIAPGEPLAASVSTAMSTV